MKRPVGLIIVCIVLAILACAAAVNAYLDLRPGPIFGIFFSIFIWLYGASAFLALVGLWKLKGWSYKAFVGWASIVMLLAVYQTPTAFDWLLGAHIALWVFVGIVLWWLARYLHKVLAAL